MWFSFLQPIYVKTDQTPDQFDPEKEDVAHTENVGQLLTIKSQEPCYKSFLEFKPIWNKTCFQTSDVSFKN